MSKKAVVELLTNNKTKEMVRATTAFKEVANIGRKNNLFFTNYEYEKVLEEVVKYINKKRNKKENIISLEQSYDNKNNFSAECYEFNLRDIKEFKALLNELDKIKIKPNAADLSLFNKTFKDEDLNFTSISPDSENFQAKYKEIMDYISIKSKCFSEQKKFNRRDFHLIGLDNYVNEELYEDYFQSKLNIVRILSNFFDAEVKLSGSFCYPPNAYRLWHTNEEAAGWRMYVIDFDEPEILKSGSSFFRYMHPETKKIVDLEDKPKLVRFFKIENQKDRLFWHCIVNRSKTFRWSYGFKVPDNWMEKIKLHTSK
ncbi:hypothetical protein [Pleurocapsa sp. PCC 7319]|uniref:hypothetical protein n=1 Tax=Pleurocapsa sp. PCC 7319 TaxID=118161 RepID=UPI0003458F0E|nr:hypothetical protein [Pleurocapsa sp. PCC 7319]